MNQTDREKYFSLFIASLLLLVTPFALFLFRSLDDNRLTSWKWVFAAIDLTYIVPIFVLGLILAYVLARIPFWERSPLFLFLSSFLVATFFWREPEVIVDASRYFTQAKHLEVYGIGYFFGEWGRTILAWTDLPLVPFLYGLIFTLFGEQRFFIQLFTTLLFSLTVVLTHMIGKTLWSDDIGFWGGLLLLGIPYLITQPPLMLVDIPTMFFLILSVFTFIKALSRGGLGSILFASIALFLAFFSKYSTWLWLSVLIIIFLVYLRMEPRKTLKRGGVIALLSLFLVLAAILLNYDVVSDQIRLLLSYQHPGLRRWGESFVSTFFYQTHPLITIAALYSIYVALKKKDFNYLIISYLICLVILLQIKRIRYIIPLFPMFTLMASYGLREMRNKQIKKFLMFGIIVSSLLLAKLAYLPFLQTMSDINIKNGGKFLNSLEVTDIQVYTLPQTNSVINPAVSVPLLDVFTTKRITYLPDFHIPSAWMKVETSPLRFTWEYKNPEYYANKQNDGEKAVVVISSTPDQALPEHIQQTVNKYYNSEAFKTSSVVFRYTTLVTVYYD